MEKNYLVTILLVFHLSISIPVHASSFEDSLSTGIDRHMQIDSIQTLLELSKSNIASQTTKAIEYGNQARLLSLQINNNPLEAKSCLIVGEGYLHLNAYARALEYFLKALRLHEDLDDEDGIALTLDKVGVIYWDIRDFDKALDYFNRSLELFQSLGDSMGVAKVLNHRGLALWSKKSYSNALEAYFEAKEINEKTDNIDELVKVLNNIGIVYDEQGLVYNRRSDHLKALEYYDCSLDINRSRGRPKGIVENLNNIGMVYFALDEYDRALDFVSRAIGLAREHGYDIEQRDSHLYFYQIYKEMGQYRNALNHYEEWSRFETRIISAEKANRIAEIQTNFTLEKKEQEIELLQLEQELKDEKLKSWQRWLLFLALAVVILASATFVIMRLHIKKNRAYRVLVKKNRAIVEYEKELNIWKSDEQRQAVIEERLALAKTLEKRNGSAHQPKVTSKPNDGQSTEGEKYSTSALTDDLKLKIMSQIRHLMEEGKVYMEHDFTINKLSETLDINRTYLSQVINEKFNKSFTQLVNEYRIQEARRQLTDEVTRLYTVEFIAKSVGFNSVNAFNRAFKKFTGITPSYYIKSTKQQ